MSIRNSSAAYVPNDSMNLMGLFYDPGTATYRILALMRPSLFTEQKVNIPYSLVTQSQEEIADMRRRIDDATSYFQQGINELVLGDGNKKNGVRTVFLATADYLGPNGEIVRANAIIPRDLGTNPWPLYKGNGGYDSVDTRITAEQATEFIGANAAALRKLYVESVLVKTSCFFYVKDTDLVKNSFMAGRQVVLDSLAAYLADTNGMVGVVKVQKPTPEEYAERAMPFNSYRQKQTLEDKVKRELCQWDPFEDNGDVISDWGGHRITAATEQEAIEWGAFFGVPADIGAFKTKMLHVDNYYLKPKGTGFKSFNIAVRVTRPSRNRTIFQPTVREVQIYDVQQHYNGQINEKSPAYHKRFKEREEESSKRRQRLMDSLEYTNILRIMFNARELEFPVPKAML